MKKRRARPGTKGKGKYYRIVVRPKSSFKSFRVQDVGGRGGVERLAGKRRDGSWDTQAWLIPKSQAHISSGISPLPRQTPSWRSPPGWHPLHCHPGGVPTHTAHSARR